PAGTFVRFRIDILLVVIPAPAFVAVQIETMHDGAQVLKVEGAVGRGERADDGPADLDAVAYPAAGRVENVQLAGGGAVVEASLDDAGRRRVGAACAI